MPPARRPPTMRLSRCRPIEELTGVPQGAAANRSGLIRWRCPLEGWSWVPVRLTWDDHDRLARLTGLAGVGLAAGAATAIFGLPPVDIHGPLHYAGIMDPLCGVTRGVRLALLGRVAQAWRYNPLS